MTAVTGKKTKRPSRISAGARNGYGVSRRRSVMTWTVEGIGPPPGGRGGPTSGSANSVEQLVGLGDRIGQRLLDGNPAEQCLLDGREDDGVHVTLVGDGRNDVRVLRDRRFGGAARAVLDERGRGA